MGVYEDFEKKLQMIYDLYANQRNEPKVSIFNLGANTELLESAMHEINDEFGKAVSENSELLDVFTNLAQHYIQELSVYLIGDE